ncbi:AAA family ATPase [Actinobacillus genomosp. 1]|uniref:AAA family ATPase n=1 Tax=Actinobacillus genomosp. 1 TaxID=254839 RepID=UPI0024416890|nr:AAA family ATPase [Actinobacillus genomosp. 1]WGE91938.1 AAA family ATPase [Actinobacillus genomosp. 1]
MKIQELILNDVGGIKSAKIKFNEEMNIICGPNGIGKTTILNSLTHAFISHYNYSKLKKRVNATEHGCFKIVINNNEEIISKEFQIDSYDPARVLCGKYDDSDLRKKCIFIGVSRIFDYKALDALKKDDRPGESCLSQNIANGIPLNNMKDWFANRCLLVGTPDALTENNKKNLEIAKNSFSIFNPDYSYARADGKTFDIFVKTPNGEIWYEYLSSGFKSCLSIVFGIIKEIETRMEDAQCLVSEFDGVVLIDELELHLHPEWQSKIEIALQEIFPQVQFIVTTHSPHIVQSAKGDQIIALAADDEGITYVRELPNSKYGYLGWTLDEVLQDVMGMKSTQSEFLTEILSKFNAAIDSEQLDDAKENFEILNKMLHPKNPLRKMVNIDYKSIGGVIND